WSDEVCAILQTPKGFAPGLEEALEFYGAKSRPLMWEALESCIKTGLSFDLELQAIPVGGVPKWVRVIGEAGHDEAGVIRRIEGAFQDIEESRQADEEKRRLAERLTNTLESITDAFFMSDREWRFTYINREAEKLLYRSREELIGEVIWKQFPEPGSSRFRHQYERAFRENQAVQFEEHYAPLGKWFEVRAYPAVHGLAVYFRDVTAQRESRDALQASEERFRLLSKATNDAVWDWDMLTGDLHWNEGYEFLFGFRAGEIEPGIDSWVRRIHPEDCTRIMEHLHHTIENGGTAWSGEYRFRRGDGHYAYVLDRGYVIRNSQGQAIRMIGGMTDLTERRLAEERFQAVFEQAAVGIHLLSPEGGFLQVNQRFCDILGYSRGELLSKNSMEITHVGDRTGEAALIAEFFTGSRRTASLEKRYVRKGGEVVWANLTLAILSDGAAIPRHFIGVIEDVSERKRGELELARSNRALQMLSRCNEALIRAENEGMLLRAISEIAVESGGFAMAGVGYALDDERKTIAPQAHAGMESQGLTYMDASWSQESPAGHGPGGEVIRSGCSVIIPDLSVEPGYQRWAAMAKMRGVRGLVALPLRDPSRTFGVLSLYLAEVRPLQPDELHLLQELADNMAFGIVTLRSRAQQRRTHDAVLAM
ncbi:MAG: PAS domain S-box protein, partial [Verrucomicrobiota bacterium]